MGASVGLSGLIPCCCGGLTGACGTRLPQVAAHSGRAHLGGCVGVLTRAVRWEIWDAIGEERTGGTGLGTDPWHPRVSCAAGAGRGGMGLVTGGGRDARVTTHAEA